MFENLGKKVSDMAQTAAKKSGELAQTAAKKSGDMVEITKLNLNITSEESSVDKLYTEIGKLYVASVGTGKEMGPAVTDMCNKIKEHKNNIEELKIKIATIKAEE